MKFLHLSDLHLGKRANEFSLLEDQDYILRKILYVVDAELPDAVLIAGDIYDKAVPSAEAVQLFDDFLTLLAGRRFDGKTISVFVISGNHDSPERLAFGSRLMDGSGVYISPVYNGDVVPVSMEDAFGPVYVYLLPFVKPVHVRAALRDTEEAETIQSYTDAVRTAIARMNVDPAVRNILVTHQFVTGAARSDSEDISVGGADNVDVSAFDGFDYVALGHLHGPQSVGRETVRYCGTPLKYSFSEASHEKSVTVVELGTKGNVSIRTVPLVPRRDMRELRGTYDALTYRKNYEGTAVDDYLRITLTDEEDIPDAAGKLRVIYPNIMELRYDNKRTRGNGQLEEIEDRERLSPLDLFSAFYEKQNNQPMSGGQTAFVRELMEEIWEGAL